MGDTVTPSQAAIPERLRRLPELANDLLVDVEQRAARSVFRRLDYPLWRQTAHNPVLMLRLISTEMVEAAAADPEFLAAVRQLDCRAGQPPIRPGNMVVIALSQTRPGRWPISRRSSRSISRCRSTPAASASSPATTARKPATSACRSSASGSCIRRATSIRTVSPEGWQMEVYERLSWADAPVDPALTPDGKPCVIAVPLGNRSVLASVWRVRLGRVTLYLLDTDLEENTPWDRELSARLYGGDREIRIQQEIILGIGGVRALKALGLAPAAWHLNEGHAAFVVLQRIRDLIEHGETLRLGARGSPADDDLHDPHAGARRPRRLPVQSGRNASGRRLGNARRVARCVPRARPLRQRQRTALQHDRARAARGQLRQRRQPAARTGDARHVGTDLAGRRSPSRGPSAQSPTASTCRPGCRRT